MALPLRYHSQKQPCVLMFILRLLFGYRLQVMGVKMLQCFPFYRRSKERRKSMQCPPEAGEEKQFNETEEDQICAR